MYALAFDMVISDLQKYYGEPYNKAYYEIKIALQVKSGEKNLLREDFISLKEKINILKGKFSISSFPIFREFLLDCLFLEYYLHIVIYMPAEL